MCDKLQYCNATFNMENLTVFQIDFMCLHIAFNCARTANIKENIIKPKY